MHLISWNHNHIFDPFFIEQKLTLSLFNFAIPASTRLSLHSVIPKLNSTLSQLSIPSVNQRQLLFFHSKQAR